MPIKRKKTVRASTGAISTYEGGRIRDREKTTAYSTQLLVIEPMVWLPGAARFDKRTEVRYTEKQRKGERQNKRTPILPTIMRRGSIFGYMKPRRGGAVVPSLKLTRSRCQRRQVCPAVDAKCDMASVPCSEGNNAGTVGESALLGDSTGSSW